MMPYTTPTHIFRLPMEADQLQEVKISYAQGGIVRLVKTIIDCSCERCEIRTSLTQEETGLFIAEMPVEIQLHILTNSGVAMQSRLIRVDCGKVLDCGVVTCET